MVNSSANYWIAANALSISLNALGDANRIQCGLATGSVIMCYIRGVEGLEYDNGHNYRRWPLTVSPTYFETNTKKYIYVAIPRTAAGGTVAQVCFPSQKIDIYGYVVDENGAPTNEQIGNDNFYYIWLQGIISEVRIDEGTAKRYFDSLPESGTLSTDEAVNPEGGQWYEWNNITQTVTFLKEIIMGSNSVFANLKARIMTLAGHTLTGVAIDSTTDEDSTTDIATPAYIKSVSDDRYLRKDQDDATPFALGVGKDLDVGENLGVGGDAQIVGNAQVSGQTTANHIQSTIYTGDGMLDAGYKLWYENGRAKLVIDDLVARGKFSVNELESRIWTYAGGNMIFSGAGSTIFFVEYLNASGEAMGYTYINSPWLLRGRALLAATIAWSKRRQIQRQLTPEEQAQVVKFRCYEFSDDGTMQTRNWWRANDLAFCQSLNHVKDKRNSDGSYSGSASNTVFWRRVAGIGSKEIDILNDGRVYDYVDLWNLQNVTGQTYKDTDGSTKTITDNVPGYDSTYNDWPAAGDVIVQRGNAVDVTRQCCVTIEVEGDQLHGFKIYDTINTYSAENTQWVSLGYDLTTGKADAKIYGDAYIGARDESTYVRYNRTTKRLDIKARIEAGSTLDENVNIGAKTFDDYVDDLIHDITDDIQEQVDQKAETWYQDTNPATAWTTDEEKNEHVGDLWYCTVDIPNTLYKKGTTWYYRKTTNELGQKVYVWVKQDIPQSVFDTMDGKASIFIARPDTVRDDGYCYRKNDMWVLAAQTTLHGVTYKQGELLMATQDSTTFVEAHWVKKVVYTDDSYATNFVNITYAADKDNLQNQIDGKYETWFYEGVPTLNNIPASEWTTAALKEEHVGDLYWDKTNENAYRFIKTVSGDTTTYSWSQIGDSSVIAAMAQAADAQDTADGKRRVFTSTPTVPYDVGDLWAEGPTGDIKKCKTAKTASQSYDAADWEKASKYTDDSTFNNWKAAEYTETIGGLNTGIGEAKDAAQAARDAADDAQTAATAANTKLSVWANDGKISPTEIRALENEEVDVKKEYTQICNEADKYSVTKAAFTTAYNAAISAFDYHTDLDNAGDDGCIDVITDSTSQYYYGNISAYYAARQTILDAIATATKNAVDAAAAAFANDPAYQAITGALDGTTVTDGGLMLSSLIALRKYNGSGDIHELSNYTTWSGISGVYDDRTEAQGGAKGHGIAAWYGGDMLDLQDGTYDPTKRYAKSLFRFDGSGYLSKGLISWDDEGVLTAANFSGVTTQLGDIKINDTTISAATLLAIFDMFTLEGAGTTASPYIIKANYSLYSQGDISALGASSGGGGGGGGGASVLYELNDVLANQAGTGVLDAQAGYVLTCVQNGGGLAWKAAAVATSLATLSDVNLSTTPTNGQVLGYNADSGKWIAKTITDYTLPAASANALGGIMIGYSGTTAKTYAVQLDSNNQAYVNVPWENTWTAWQGATANANGVAGYMPAPTTSQRGSFLRGDGSWVSVIEKLAWWVDSESHNVDDLTSGTTFAYTSHNAPVNGTIVAFSNQNNNYQLQLQGSYSGEYLYFRNKNGDNGTWNTWRYVIHSGNIGSQSVSYASSAGGVAWSNVSDRPTVPTASSVNSGYAANADMANKVYMTSHIGTWWLNSVWDDSTYFWLSAKYNNDSLPCAVSYASSAGNADTCDNLHVHSGRNNEANKIVRTDDSGYMQCGWINTTSGGFNGAITGITKVYCSEDDYIRYLSPSDFISALSLLTTAGGTLTGLLRIKTGTGIEDASGNGMLCYHPDSWTGVSSSQWGVGAVDCQGVIRSSNAALIHYKGGTAYEIIDTSGGQTIGGNLSITGDFYATGDVTAASDERLKNIKAEAVLTIDEIANAPAIKFEWKDKSQKGIHTGTLAQYWQKILPESVSDLSGTLAMNYGAASMVAVINVAKCVVSHEDQIKQLKKRISELESEVEQLKTA